MAQVLLTLALEVIAIFVFLSMKSEKLPETLKVEGWVRKYPLLIQRSIKYRTLQEVGFLLLAPEAKIPEHPHDANNEAYLRVTLKGLKLIDVCREGNKHHLNNDTGKFKLIIYVKWKTP